MFGLMARIARFWGTAYVGKLMGETPPLLSDGFIYLPLAIVRNTCSYDTASLRLVKPDCTAVTTRLLFIGLFYYETKIPNY